MSDYASAAEFARRASASVERLERALSRDPASASLQINLAARRRYLRKAEADLYVSAEYNQVDICNYRLLPEATNRFLVSSISPSLLAYQLVFSQIYDAIKNGAKQRAVIGAEAAEASAMEFGYTYSGSLGFVLLAPSERDFIEGKLDSSIDAVFQVLEIGSEDEVRDIARNLGEAVVKRVHDWSKVNVDGGYAIDLRWNRSDGRQLGQVVGLGHMEKIVSIISSTSDEKTRSISFVGTLVGLNVDSGAFQLSAPDEVGDYRGVLAESFNRAEAHAVPGIYRATLSEATTVAYATGRITTKFQLQRLESELTA